MPRLWHQFLSQQTKAQQDAPFQESITQLIVAQEKQAKSQRWMIAIIIILVLLQCASLLIILFN